MNYLRPGWPLVVGLVAAIAVYLLTISSFRDDGVRRLQAQEMMVERELQLASGRIERWLHERRLLASGLKGLVQTRPEVTSEEFEVFASQLVSSVDGVRAVQLVRGTVITHVHPLEGNEPALGLDLGRIPGWRAKLEAQLRNREFSLEGPNQLVQGGRGIVCRLPIIDDDGYAGLVVIMMDFDRMASVMSDELKNVGIDVCLFSQSGHSEAPDVHVGHADVLGNGARTVEVRYLGGVWTLAGLPERGWIGIGMAPVTTAWTWLGTLLTGMLTWWLAGIPQGLRISVQKATADLKDRITMLDAAHEAMAFIGPDRICRDMNPSFTRQFGPVDGDTVLFDRIVTTSSLQEALTEALQGRPQSVFHNTTGSGETRIHEVTLTPIANDRGDVTGVVFVGRDVTSRRRSEEEMQKHERLHALGVLAGGIAHDFNNYLGAILGNLELIRLQHLEGSNITEEVENLRAAVNQASGLTRQLLTFSTGGAPVREIVRLETLVRGNLKFVLAGSGIEGDLEIEDELPLVHVDPTQISQVINNLTLNARQAMQDSGTIHVTLRPTTVVAGVEGPIEPGNWVEIVIRDDGPGMPPELMSRIFDPFFTTKSEGSGIGLAVVHSVITRHEGHVFVESTSGEGTTFRIYLPAAAETAVPDTPPPRLESLSKLRVLVVDDNEPIRMFVRRLLTAAGHDVVIAAGSKDALAAAREDPVFDVVILDLTLPGDLDGVEILLELRKISGSLPAIAMSGYTTHDVMGDPAKYGFQHVLAKPFTFEKLIIAVEETVKSGGN